MNLFDAIEETKTRTAAYQAIVEEIIGSDNTPLLLSAMAWSCRQLGYETDGVRSVSDADLAEIKTDETDVFLDLVEFRTLELLNNNLTIVTNQTGQVRDDWNDLGKRLPNILKEKRAILATMYKSQLPAMFGTDQPKIATIRAFE